MGAHADAHTHKQAAKKHARPAGQPQEAPTHMQHAYDMFANIQCGTEVETRTMWSQYLYKPQTHMRVHVPYIYMHVDCMYQYMYIHVAWLWEVQHNIMWEEAMLSRYPMYMYPPPPAPPQVCPAPRHMYMYTLSCMHTWPAHAAGLGSDKTTCLQNTDPRNCITCTYNPSALPGHANGPLYMLNILSFSLSRVKSF